MFGLPLWALGILAVLVVLAFVFVWALCAIAATADEDMERKRREALNRAAQGPTRHSGGWRRP